MVVLVVCSVIAAVLLLGAAVDWRARRRGRQVRSGYDIYRERREFRRDVRAWDKGSVGHGGEDVSWMKGLGR
jgi:hypothetical protein